VSKMGDGYGSECHLLRWMGRHRNRLDQEVLSAVGLQGRVEWLDFHFDPSAVWPDGEWKGLDFLADDAGLQTAWADFWPQSGNAMNWDAVAWVDSGESRELLLVEAKAHLGEIASSCGAKGPGREKIARALDETKRALGVEPACDWVNGYYQLANRLAVLHFLGRRDVPAHLLLVYFVGDRQDSGRDCPDSAEGWMDALRRQDDHLGLAGHHVLSARLHKLFLPATGTKG